MPRLIPYGRQWVSGADVRAVVAALRSDFLTQGPRIEEFERKLCALTGARYCVAVCNGTAALHLAVASLGLRKGLKGVVPANTFAASGNALAYNGLVPVVADIDPGTYNLSVPNLERKLTKDVRVVVPVDFAGQPAELERIHALARKRGLFVVEDAAHAVGSRYRNGTPVGNCRYSDLTTFSFHPVKTITCGEGGAVTTNDKTLYERLRMLRTHGIVKENLVCGASPGPWYYEMQALGFNYRMTDLQAALGSSQLDRLGAFVKRRRALVARYNEAFKGLPLATLPREGKGVYSAFHLYVLQIDFERLGKSRKRFMAELLERGVGTQVHYIPLTRQPYYRKTFGCRPQDTPVAERYYQRALSLPLYPRMSDADAARVIRVVKAALKPA